MWTDAQIDAYYSRNYYGGGRDYFDDPEDWYEEDDGYYEDRSDDDV